MIDEIVAVFIEGYRMVPRKGSVGLGKFWPDLEISEALLMGLEVSFWSDFCVLESRFFFTKGSRSLVFVVFYFRLVFRSRKFSEITGIAYRPEPCRLRQ